MSKEIKRTYVPYQEFPEKSKQIEYTAPTPLLAEDGTLLAKGWARRNYFDFDMKKVSKRWRKEWEFYLISNRKYLVIVSIATVAIGGFMDVSIVDLEKGENVESAGTLFFGNKCKLTDKGDEPGGFSFCANKTSLEVINTDRSREIHFRKGDDIYCDFQMDLFEDHESLTTVFPFHGDKKKFFLTTKQNSMPCAGTFVNGDKKYTFTKEDTFCCMDWGRVAAPRKFVWYWGNGSQYIYDDEGKPSNDPVTYGTEEKYISSMFLEKGDYLKLNNLTLGYTLPSSLMAKVKVQSLRVSLNVTNLFTLTGFSGYNPEVPLDQASAASFVSYNSMPQARTYSLGLNLIF